MYVLYDYVLYICGPCSECIPILPVLYVCLYVAVPADGECRRSRGHGGLRCGDKGQRVPAWGDGTRLHRCSLRDTGHGSHCVKGALLLCTYVHTYILWLQYVCTYMHICVCACCVHVCTRLSISNTARVWHATLVHIAVCVHICTYVCTYVCMPSPHVLQWAIYKQQVSGLGTYILDSIIYKTYTIT